MPSAWARREMLAWASVAQVTDRDWYATAMIRYVKTMRITTKLWLLVGIFSLVVIGDNLAQMVLHGQRLRAEKEQQLEQLVDAAHSALGYYESEVRSGRLSESEARRLAIAAIRPLRYSQREYFWLHDLTEPVPRMVMHPTVPSLDGTILNAANFMRATSSRRGSQGPYRPLANENLFVAMNEVARSTPGQGFVTYDWPKPLAGGGVTATAYPKLSFVKHFQPWGWVIGSGIYMDDFEATYWREIQTYFVKAGLSLLLFGVIVWAMLRTIIHPLRALQQSITSLRNDPDSVVTLPTDQPQELGQLGSSFQSLMGELQKSRRALHASFDELKLAGCAFAEIAEGVVVTDAVGHIVSINPAFTRISGYTQAQAIGRTPSLLKSGKHDGSFYANMWHQLTTRGMWSGEIWNRASDGHIYPEWLSISSARNADGQIVNYVGVFSDISERKAAEADLRIAATAFDSQEGMFITDAHSVILRVNSAFSAITGYTAQEAVGQTPRLLKSGHHDEAFYGAMHRDIENTGAWQGEVWNRRKNGEVFPEWLTITAVHNNDKQVSHYVSTLTDITKRKEAEDQIRDLAFFDPLTRLPNRRLLLDRLQLAMSSSKRSGRCGAIFFIDLDNFKAINDTFGHHMGDLLLQQVATRLVESLRETDTVARLGGDEFVVMLEELSTQRYQAAQQAKAVAEKLIAALNLPYVLGELEYHNTPSIGISMFEDHQSTLEEVLKRADLAMYQAKAAGRNTLRFFDPEVESQVHARTVLEGELLQAITHSQLVLHYQVQVDDAGRLLGAEALVRWQHPSRGLVSPVAFIGLAEETGLIIALGRWVLESACHQLVAWSKQPATSHLCVAVNISAVQCRQADFVAQVLALIEQTGARADRLKLELTESLLLDHIEEMIGKMQELKSRGIQFSLDDFGTGYSSLSYLKRLPIDQLKIDQSFVRDLLTDPDDTAIVRTIVALAENLHVSVIAEGVETQAQRDCLAALGCHHYQGYFFGRPGPIETLALA